MIVVSIIALLTVVALPSFLRARKRAQNARFISSLRVLHQFGFVAGVSVVTPDIDQQQLLAIDAQIDDGNLSTGNLRQTAPARYTEVLE